MGSAVSGVVEPLVTTGAETVRIPVAKSPIAIRRGEVRIPVAKSRVTRDMLVVRIPVAKSPWAKPRPICVPLTTGEVALSGGGADLAGGHGRGRLSRIGLAVGQTYCLRHGPSFGCHLSGRRR